MIYILGGNGFIGSAFSRHCAAARLDYRIIDRRNYDSYVGTKCDVFINAAGNSKKYLSAKDPLKDFEASVRSVRASLDNFSYETYVLISSADVYPDSSSPLSTLEHQKLDPAIMTPYGFHKYLGELCVCHVAKRWLVIRGGGFVGPDLKKNAIYDILHGGPLWLDPNSELQYIHTDQAAALIFQLIDLGLSNEVFNLSAAGTVKLSQVLEWTKSTVFIHSDSPRVRCELNLSKVSRYLALPETHIVVRNFVGSFSNI